jgi:tRNA (cytidine/uridine-2'-O-)-methyltransferase
MPRLALFQPDIPQNTGTMLRLAACLGAPVEIIEPAGFDVSDRNLRRAGLDYLERVAVARHASWRAFDQWRSEHGLRLVLATTKGALPYTEFAFDPHDVILLGRESAGVPDEVHRAADARVVIPMQPGLRSLNVAVAAAMLLGEALRQTGCFPALFPKERADWQSQQIEACDLDAISGAPAPGGQSVDESDGTDALRLPPEHPSPAFGGTHSLRDGKGRAP